MVEFRVLGTLEVLRGEETLPVPSRRQRALITRLLLGGGAMVPADALVDAVWETEPPKDARHALHAQVSRLRALLGPEVLLTRAPGYLLATGPHAVDADRFAEGVREAGGLAATDPAGAVALLDELLGLWRGPAYAEFAGSFARAAAVRLEELRLTARERRVAALLAAGERDRAVSEAGELAADHPVREGPQALLMRALYLAGRHSDALAAYHRFRDRLAGELGLDPSPALRSLHEQVLRQQIPDPASPARPSPARSSPAPSSPAGTPPVGAPPLPATSFLGRERELRDLRGLLAAHRIITLVGPGGVGKTRLARELIATLTGPPVRWIDLARVREPADLPYRVVDSLGLPQPAEQEVVDFLADALRPVRALLVVDNCEHVIAPAAEILSRIVAACPDVVVLATSREPLAVAGERVLALAPLPGPDPGGPAPGESPAVALFADRFRAAGGPGLSTAELAEVAEVCQRVGGLPLAIELAAARARSLGLATVAERPSLDLLTSGRRGDADRHRSLRAVLDWSHDLLTSGERILFRRLAGFSGPFTLDDAEQVCADATLPPARVPEALAGLVEKSMVTAPVRDRCRLLDPTRAYAAEQLAAHGEDRWVAAGHARHCLRLAEQAEAGLRTAREAECVTRLADRVDELRVAHRWACAHDADLAVRLAAALATYARYHQRFELQDWAAAAAALPDAAGHPLRAAALGSAAAGAWARGEFERAERWAGEGIAAAPEGDPVAAGPNLVLGDVALLAGRLTEADQAYRRAEALAGARDPHVTCEALGSRALVRCFQGDQEQALALATAGEKLAGECGSPGMIAMARYFAGECRLATDPQGALELLAESRQLATDAGALLVVGLATVSWVSLRARTNDAPAEAFAAYREAIEHWRRVGSRTQQWVTLRNLVPLLVRAGRYELALVLHGALESAPVGLPAEVVVPETEVLAGAVAEARQRLGDRAGQATARGARARLEDLVTAVLAELDEAAVPGRGDPGTAAREVADQAGSRR